MRVSCVRVSCVRVPGVPPIVLLIVTTSHFLFSDNEWLLGVFLTTMMRCGTERYSTWRYSNRNRRPSLLHTS